MSPGRNLLVADTAKALWRPSDTLAHDASVTQPDRYEGDRDVPRFL